MASLLSSAARAQMVFRQFRRPLCLASPLRNTVPHVTLTVLGKGMPVTIRNIYCIGRNYVEHAIELNNPVPKEEPVIFMKSSAALRGLMSDEPTAFAVNERFHHELEMVLLVGKDVELNGFAAGKETECIQAVGLGLDLTRRDVQSSLKKRGLPWTTAKSFAGSAIVSPMISLDGLRGSFDLQNAEFELRVNKKLRQKGVTSNMIFDIPTQLRFINSLVPLLRGDLIFTGTPEGVDTIVSGDEFEMKFTTGSKKSPVWSGVL